MSHRPVVLLLALAGCSRPPQPAVERGASGASGADTVAQGMVRVVGPVETAEVILRGAPGSVALLGPLAGELRRLSGATLRVSGTAQTNPAMTPPRAVVVHAYEILDQDGQRPLVGVVLSRDGRLWLAAQDTVELVGATPELAARAGARVWVVGQREGDRIRVQSYGVIRDPR